MSLIPPLGTDKFGVDIPYFDQIRNHMGDLGYGRSGSVTGIEWHGKEAALKKFFDVDRSEVEAGWCFYDRYEHELTVFRDLHKLWGTYVPALLFHKPWRTSPLIGMQVGKPIDEDDISKWPEEDQAKAEETIAKVEEFGWKQEDLRGNNCIRLVGRDGVERIAMIDFESMVKMS